MSALSRESLETISSWTEVLTVVFTMVGAFCGVVYVSTNRPLRRLEALDAEREKQATALAQKEAAEARLKLDQWFAKKIFHRIASPENFERLKQLPKSTVEVQYKDGDGEAFLYASTMVQDFKGIGWKVSPKPIPTTHHPMVGNEGNPIIGTFVLARSIPQAAEVFKQLQSPTSPAFLVAAAVEGQPLESKSIPENTFVVVVGEYLRSWNQ